MGFLRANAAGCPGLSGNAQMVVAPVGTFQKKIGLGVKIKPLTREGLSQQRVGSLGLVAFTVTCLRNG